MANVIETPEMFRKRVAPFIAELKRIISTPEYQENMKRRSADSVHIPLMMKIKHPEFFRSDMNG